MVGVSVLVGVVVGVKVGVKVTVHVAVTVQVAVGVHVSVGVQVGTGVGETHFPGTWPSHTNPGVFATPKEQLSGVEELPQNSTSWQHVTGVSVIDGVTV
jgi:hypothetical protein